MYEAAARLVSHGLVKNQSSRGVRSFYITKMKGILKLRVSHVFD